MFIISTHQYDKNMRPDSDFIYGNLSFLIEGNRCRLLDGRRTTGYIEGYNHESAMFRWRITKYEDKGKCWDLPAESIKSFQFEKDSKKLDKDEVKEIEEKIRAYDKKLYIKVEATERNRTEALIKGREEKIEDWLSKYSRFFKSEDKLDFGSREGSSKLAEDLKDYMRDIGLYDIERKTAEILVLNPGSGEWIKGMEIVLAEMGLVYYEGKIPRTKDIFTGLGSKEKRREYLINRLAFLRTYFRISGIKELVLYRGMSNENYWIDKPRTFLSCTFSYDVANDFANFDRESKYKTSYIIKMTCPIEKIFMTYLESEALNKKYKEAEALILYDEKIML